MKYMLDTNICIYAIKKMPETVLSHLQRVKPQDVCISSVTFAELMHGVFKSKAVERNQLALSVLLSNIGIMDFGVEAAESYGRIRADLEKDGTPIGPLDTMIAGHAIALGCTLVTNNGKEFSRVKGLKTVNWAE
ncbi:MAG: type II toxin-antitoxin system VapC family toxin [Lachnospiraceae bacterium]|nr:type II toxin-antitoxin system VapC family toxin [Lachnospiraceae bacterium]